MRSNYHMESQLSVLRKVSLLKDTFKIVAWIVARFIVARSDHLLLAEKIADPHRDFLRRNSTRYLFGKRYLSLLFVWQSMCFDGQNGRVHGDARKGHCIAKNRRTIGGYVFLTRCRCSYIIWVCHDSTYAKNYVPSKLSDELVVCGHFKRAKLAKKPDPQFFPIRNFFS